MGKFRSKLKRHGKGKTWSKGQSATSNPEQMKHRMKAKSRFFQPNLSLGEFCRTSWHLVEPPDTCNPKPFSSCCHAHWPHPGGGAQA